MILPKQIKQQIDADVIPLFGDMELEKIKPRDITKALDTIVNRGSPIHDVVKQIKTHQLSSFL